MADELRFTFFHKRAHAFLIILAVVDGAAHPLNTFELIGIHGVRLAKHAQLFLNDRYRQRRFLGNVVRHLLGKIFQFASVHHVIENTDRQRALGGNRQGGENQLFHDMKASVTGQIVNADQVVGHAEIHRRHGER